MNLNNNDIMMIIKFLINNSHTCFTKLYKAQKFKTKFETLKKKRSINTSSRQILIVLVT